VAEAEASGQLADLYRRLAYEDGSVDEAYTALSLSPALLEADAAMYQATMYGDSPLSRAERELLALTVSRLNSCGRCLRHHAARYKGLTGRDAAVAQAETAPGQSHSVRERALLSFAEKLTRRPDAVIEADIDALRQAGLDDRSILDACNTVAYFNYANRMTLGLGLSPRAGVPGTRPHQAR
jgi:uncharacterized peroxidase-related enzyme